jgi:peptide subunit release factor RF-3
MSVPKETWKMLDEVRQHYMTIVEELNDMDRNDQLTWLEITEAIEEEIKIAKSKLEAIMKPEEHKRRLENEIKG